MNEAHENNRRQLTSQQHGDQLLAEFREERAERFGYMRDLILALRQHGVPMLALQLTYFTEAEQAWIKDGYSVSISLLQTERTQ